MTRPYIAKRLLEHGPLTWAEFIEITRWKNSRASSALARLIRRKEVRIVNINGARHYRLEA